jgi:hypothetical protein
VNEENCLGENDGKLMKPPMLRIKGKADDDGNGNGSSSHHQIGCYSRCKGLYYCWLPIYLIQEKMSEGRLGNARDINSLNLIGELAVSLKSSFTSFINP